MATQNNTPTTPGEKPKSKPGDKASDTKRTPGQPVPKDDDVEENDPRSNPGGGLTEG